MRVALTKPITAHGQEVHELEMREPAAGDVMECGYPLTIGEGEATPNAEAVGRLISKLAGVPPSSVKQMNLADFNAAMAVLLGFFAS